MTESGTRDTVLAVSVSDRIRIPGKRSTSGLLRFDTNDGEFRTVRSYDGTIRLLDHHTPSGRSLLHLAGGLPGIVCRCLVGFDRAYDSRFESAGSGGGFLVGSGCIVPRYSPLENVQAMFKAVRDSQ